ncbi:hypothetical protein [Burkholderia ubonensis]|uniref:hypothetical protein n=1 Tax=Burkholderia ubonensis TaxID=101571 RepID=UPI0012FCB01C|nr:hypothetical protein [Burkholderia ubonensis]
MIFYNLRYIAQWHCLLGAARQIHGGHEAAKQRPNRRVVRMVGDDVDEYREKRGNSIAESRRHWALRGTRPTPPSSSAAITVQLLALYYQTDATAAPGTADGIATFAIVYR